MGRASGNDDELLVPRLRPARKRVKELLGAEHSLSEAEREDLRISFLELLASVDAMTEKVGNTMPLLLVARPELTIGGGRDAALSRLDEAVAFNTTIDAKLAAARARTQGLGLVVEFGNLGADEQQAQFLLSNIDVLSDEDIAALRPIGMELVYTEAVLEEHMRVMEPRMEVARTLLSGLDGDEQIEPALRQLDLAVELVKQLSNLGPEHFKDEPDSTDEG